MITKMKTITLTTDLKKLFKKIVDFINIDQTIFSVLIILGVINVFLQYSANDQMLNRMITDVIYLILSFIIFSTIANTNLNHLQNFAIPIYVISILLLIAVFFFGIKSHGVSRWLNVGIRIQPSEICKLSVPLMLSYYFHLHENKISTINYIIGFILVLIPFALISKQPDLGTAILVFVPGFFVMFFGGLSYRAILISFVILILLTPLIWHFLHDYQRHRILTLLNPHDDKLGRGYHIIQGMVAIGSGGFWGKGYLNGTQIHLDFIPEKGTDFAISILAEEFGFVGVSLVFILYIILILRGLNIMIVAKTLFERLLAGGITMSFLVNVVVNAGMVAGIFPVVGVPLPLISYGGTATMITMIEFGILLAIYKNSKYDLDD